MNKIPFSRCCAAPKFGRMNVPAGPYGGINCFEARKKLWADMDVGIKPWRTNLDHI